jgi:molybdopterin molybdotransferase
MSAQREPDWLSPAEARDRILASVAPLSTHRLPLHEALGAVLAAEIAAPLDLPAWDNSAMDGFAVRAEDVRGASAGAPVTLPVVDDVAAGSFNARALAPGEAVRVMTGARVPEGADTVIRVEHTDGGRGLGTHAATVRISSDLDAGRNIRRRGEDFAAGDVLLEPGRVVRPAEIGVAASVGRSQLTTVRPPVVGILTSGDELVDMDRFDQVLEGRRIVSSGTHAVAAQVREAGGVPRMLGIARDTPESLAERVAAAVGCDILITTAGVAVGEHDHTLSVLEEFGLELDFWRVKMRPGPPLAFGRLRDLGDIPWFGLPGNPVSTMVTFELFVRPALLRMAGHSALFAPTVRARLREDFRASTEVHQFLRVRLTSTEEGFDAHLTGAQGSGMLTSMAAADGLLALPPGGSGTSSVSLYPTLLLGARPLAGEPGY